MECSILEIQSRHYKGCCPVARRKGFGRAYNASQQSKLTFAGVLPGDRQATASPDHNPHLVWACGFSTFYVTIKSLDRLCCRGIFKLWFRRNNIQEQTLQLGITTTVYGNLEIKNPAPYPECFYPHLHAHQGINTF